MPNIEQLRKLDADLTRLLEKERFERTLKEYKEFYEEQLKYIKQNDSSVEDN